VARLATLGYALPGAVIAAGVLLTLAPIDRAINNIAQQMNLSAPGLILTGTIVGLMYAYSCALHVGRFQQRRGES
jgi:iron(III) transport system permease protein